jgi:hypothetical protein
MAHGDARAGKWRGNWRMVWVASTLHTTSEHGVSSITTADAHTSASSSRLNWRPRRFKWTRPFRRKTKSGICACVVTFQLASANDSVLQWTFQRLQFSWRISPFTSCVGLKIVFPPCTWSSLPFRLAFISVYAAFPFLLKAAVSSTYFNVFNSIPYAALFFI